MTNRYEVDAAMLGEDWQGDASDLRQFCRNLQGIVGKGVEITPVTSSHDGASNEDPGLVSDRDWQAAVEASPGTWWRTSDPWAVCDRCGRHVEADLIACLDDGAPSECRCGLALPNPPAAWLIAHGYGVSREGDDA